MAHLLSDDILHSYTLRGHSHIHNLLSPDDLKKLSEAVESVIANLTSSQSDMEDAVLSYGKSWIFIENTLRFNSYLKEFFLFGPLQALAQQLLRCPQAFLLRDQTYYKYQGGQETPWHQDCLFIPEDDLETVTFWIPFHEINSNHSPMSYIDQSHNYCYLGSSFDRLHTFDTFKAIAETDGHSITTYDRMSSGDVLAHSGWTLHGSPPMPDCSSRKAIVIVYTSTPPRLDASLTVQSCHRDLRSQAFQIRSANQSSYQSLTHFLSS